jgi:hypothetical protein
VAIKVVIKNDMRLTFLTSLLLTYFFSTHAWLAASGISLASRAITPVTTQALYRD